MQDILFSFFGSPLLATINRICMTCNILRFFIDITGFTMCRNAGNNNCSGNQQRDWHKNQLLTLKQVFFLIIDECFKFFY